ncbi:DUF6414 family protein [Vibrio harveyi]|uniref:DUF6414 family protein n=1 Tax=Vibrio harveyi TaxID=669 RepID=UPI0031BA7561
MVKKIKNFIYLDQDKMYSLSSQLFEGITEYILNEKSSENHESESQKGPVGSGRVLGDVIISTSKSQERKFFHDYSFTLFERHLLEHHNVLDLTDKNIKLDELKDIIGKYSFVKIKSKATFNDVNKITELFANFNNIGRALAHATNYPKIQQVMLDKKNIKSKSKSEAARITSEYKRLTNIDQLAINSNLAQDPVFLENLSLLTKYGFSEDFEITQNINDIMFTSNLERAYLREKENLLVKKYSRKTEKEVVVFGMISQAFEPTALNIEESDGADLTNMKSAILNLIEHLCNMETTLSGKQYNEVVIDPIAAYIEV